jgi:hypothetical protein
MRTDQGSFSAACAVTLLVVGLSGCGGSSGRPVPSQAASALVSAMSDRAASRIHRENDALYVANADGNSITVYALDAVGSAEPLHTIAGPHTGLNHPQEIAVDASGMIYAVNGDLSTVRVYRPRADGDVPPSRTISGPATGFVAIEGIAADASRAFYVTNVNGAQRAGSVEMFGPDANGNVAPTKTFSTDGEPALGIALDTRGGVVVGLASFTQSTVNALLACSPSLLTCRTLVNSVAERLAIPGGIAVDPHENIFVFASFLANEIQIFTAPGYALTGTIALGQTGGRQIAVDAADDVYAIEGNAVVVFAPTEHGYGATPARSISGPRTRLDGPSSLAVGPRW